MLFSRMGVGVTQPSFGGSVATTDISGTSWGLPALTHPNMNSLDIVTTH